MKKEVNKKTNVRYDVNTDKEIVDYIIKNPGNIQKACKELSIKLNRTPNANPLYLLVKTNILITEKTLKIQSNIKYLCGKKLSILLIKN